MAKKVTTFRLEPALLAWVTKYAEQHGKTRNSIVEELLEALHEGRLSVRPRSGPNPFPAEEVEAGTTPEYPLQIAWPGAEVS
jgi:hypothetical protein